MQIVVVYWNSGKCYQHLYIIIFLQCLWQIIFLVHAIHSSVYLDLPSFVIQEAGLAGKKSMTQKVIGAWKIEVTFDGRYYGNGNCNTSKLLMLWIVHFVLEEDEEKKMNFLFISSFVVAHNIFFYNTNTYFYSCR